MITIPGPGIAVTVTEPVQDPILEGADFCEVRADLWHGPTSGALAFVQRSPRPVIFTCRIPAEGGRFRGSEDDRGRGGNEIRPVVLTQGEDIEANLIGELDGF